MRPQSRPMGKFKIRFITARQLSRGVEYRWVPSPELRSAGFRIVVLGDDFPIAAAKARGLNDQVDAWRKGAPIEEVGIETPASKVIQPATLAATIRHYQSTRHWTDLRERTRTSYQHNIKLLEAWGGDKRVVNITGNVVEALYSSLYKKTPAKAKAMVVMLKILLADAQRQGLISSNPAAKMRLKGARPSGRIWPRAAVSAFIAMADKVGMPAVGTAVAIAHWFGVREGDVLTMPRTAWRGGRLEYRTSKTSVDLSIPENESLRDRVAGEIARQEKRRKEAEAAGRKPAIPMTLLVTDDKGMAWSEFYFRHCFAAIRKALAAEQPEIAGVRTESLLFRHLRHTAVTELSIAGRTPQQIRSITGHSLATINQILEVYLVLTRDLADGAQQAREDHYAKAEEGK